MSLSTRLCHYAESGLLSRRWVGIATLAVLYYIAGRLSLMLTMMPGYPTALWAASGIGLAGLLLGGKNRWPGIILGSFFITVTVSLDTSSDLAVIRSVGVALSLGVGAALQALVGAALITRYVPLAGGLLHASEVIKFLTLGGPVSCLVNATLGVTILWLFRDIFSSEYLFSWVAWWVSDTIGVLTVVPLALAIAGRPRAVWRKRATFLVESLLLTLIVVVILSSLATTQERTRIDAEFDDRARLIRDSLQKKFASYLEILRSVRSFYASSEEVTQAEFHRFTERALARVPSIQALSWNPRISASQRALLEGQRHHEGLPPFVVTERDTVGQLVPAALRPDYVVVHYIEPLAGNEKALGFDVYSDPTRRAALDLAQDSGEPVATARITLVQETGQQAGILVFLPVYANSIVSLDGIEGRAQLRGYVAGVFRIGDVLAAAASDAATHDIEARLYDQIALDEKVPLAAYRFDTDGRGALFELNDIVLPPATRVWSDYLFIGTRHWQLRVTPTAQYLPTERTWVAWSVPLVGLAFTGLLSTFLLILTGRGVLDNQRAQELTRVNHDLAKANTALRTEVVQRERTEQALYAEKERAEITLHSIGDGVITTDADGHVDYLNPTAEKISEWTTAEVRGKPLMSIFRIIDEETRQPLMDPVVRCRQERRSIGLTNHAVLITRSGREYAIQDSVAPIWDRDGHLLGTVLVFNDVSETRRMAREAAYHASHDLLTGLVNRREFNRRLERTLASNKQHGLQHALCYLDLDQFKIVNDTAGHQAGDELLKQIATLLKTGIRHRDTLARLGGDEFGLLLDNCPLDKAIEIAELLVATVRDFTFVWNRRSFELGISIGLVPVTGRLHTAEETLAQADVACYAAKEAGRNRVYVYQSDGDGADPRHREIQRAADVHSAIERNRFRLVAQPIVTLDTQKPGASHYEILLRMLDERDRILAPGDFILAAERYGIMNAIDRWVIRTVFRDLHRLFPSAPVPLLAINLSGNSLNDDDLLPFLQDQFAEHGVAPQRICFEITETAAIRNLNVASDFIHQIRTLGSHFALDDFGTGLSSFAYLKQLPVDFLKLDGSFVRNIANNPCDQSIVEAIAKLADKLHIHTIAECVETSECLALLRELGVTYAQGYAIGAPMALPLVQP